MSARHPLCRSVCQFADKSLCWRRRNHITREQTEAVTPLLGRQYIHSRRVDVQGREQFLFKRRTVTLDSKLPKGEDCSRVGSKNPGRVNAIGMEPQQQCLP